MTSSRIQEFYERQAKFYQTFFIGFLQWESVLATFFSQNDYLRSDMKILDAGCGTGAVTKVLVRLARQRGLAQLTFHAFDLTPAMLALFRQWTDAQAVPEIKLQQAEVLDLENQLPPDWTDYDLIVCSAMLEYVPKAQVGQALGGLRRRLNPNGTLLVFLTRKTWISNWLGKGWWGANTYHPDQIEAECRRAGLKTVRFKRLPGLWRSSMMAIEARN